MPSNRRIKTLLAILAACVILFLYYSNEAGQTSSGEFYHRTSAALDTQKKTGEDKPLQAKADVALQAILKHKQDVTGVDSAAEIASFVAAAEARHSSYAGGDLVGGDSSKKGVQKPSKIEEDVEEISVAGRKTMSKAKPKWDTGIAKDEEAAMNGGNLKQETIEQPGMEEAKAELNAILKKSPIIIFSKTYCQFSRRAKSLLLDTYKITPAPYVVELDQLSTPISTNHDHKNDHAEPVTLGTKLQELLQESTGRRTVPNILINGKSIGGSDEIAKLDSEGELIKKIRDMGGRWVHEAVKRGGPGSQGKERGKS